MICTYRCISLLMRHISDLRCSSRGTVNVASVKPRLLQHRSQSPKHVQHKLSHPFPNAAKRAPSHQGHKIQYHKAATSLIFPPSWNLHVDLFTNPPQQQKQTTRRHGLRVCYFLSWVLFLFYSSSHVVAIRAGCEYTFSIDVSKGREG